MGKLTLFIGGARSGKSRCAQETAKQYNDVAYLATAINTDGEMEARINAHQKDRPDSWRTYECPYNPSKVILDTNHEVYLLDCVTVFVTNLILEVKGDWTDMDVLTFEEQSAIEAHIGEKTTRMVRVMREKKADFIVVTNEVGMGVVPQNPLGRLFRDIAGRVNQEIAAAADEVWLTVSGIPVKIKG